MLEFSVTPVEMLKLPFHVVHSLFGLCVVDEEAEVVDSETETMKLFVLPPCGDADDAARGGSDRKAGFETVRLGGAVFTVAHYLTPRIRIEME